MMTSKTGTTRSENIRHAYTMYQTKCSQFYYHYWPCIYTRKTPLPYVCTCMRYCSTPGFYSTKLAFGSIKLKLKMYARFAL